MGIRGPAPKSAGLRIAEGSLAHRPLPVPGVTHIPGMPERPRGMSAGARRVWDEYLDRLEPLGILRAVDGFALRRLCEDVALLQELQSGAAKVARQRKKLADGEVPSGGAATDLAMSPEGRRLAATINALAIRIARAELQFGLTPVASQRLENLVVSPMPSQMGMDAAELALCG